MNPRKGRGAQSNRGSRFLATHSEFDPGEVPDSVATEVLAERARSIITTNRSPDVPFDQSINPYRGCEHGCIYCYARPSHAYMDLSPGLDFETRLFYKAGAAELLERALNRPGYVCKPIALGANTDPYQPIEKRYRVTRELLEVLWRYRHPVTIVTKSNLILRDLELLAAMAAERLCQVAISVTTLDNDLKRIMEPRAPAPSARLAAVRALTDAGVPVSVLAAPMIPRINDAELEHILEAAADAGAVSADYILLRLPLEVAPLFEEWLQQHFPDRAAHVMSLIRQSRGGKANQAEFGRRMTGDGVFAQLLAQRCEFARNKLGLHGRSVSLDTSRFILAEKGQLSLFS